MRQARQIEVAKRIFGYIDANGTAMADALYRNDVSTYTDPLQTRQEIDELFGGWPLHIALSCELPEPGDYLTLDHLAVPVLLTRNREGDVRAFMNVCRHRGAKVADGSGTGRKVFTCPYHAWSYDLDGALKAVPFDHAFAGCDKADMALRPLPVQEKYGMIWVRTAPDADFEIDQALKGTEDDLAHLGIADYHHYETRTLRVGMNWKLVIDTFLESYHINVLHKNSIAPIIRNNRSSVDKFGENFLALYPRWSIDEMRDQPEQDWDLIKHSVMIYVLFPNTVFVVQGDHLETWRVYPENGDTERAVMDVGFYIPEPATTESARRHWDRNMDLLMKTVLEEDFPLGEGIQRGFHSGAQDHITFGRNEPALHYFHQAIKQSLGRADRNSPVVEAA